ncbi:MAG: hypothetical protein WC819_02435 [Parcubacteria group bacterium]|jgi:hypothetical protein
MGAAEGMNPKKIRTIDMVFAVLITACGAIFFLIVTRAMNGESQSAWLVPFFSATIFAALLSIFAVTVGVKKLISPIVFIAFLPSIIFTPTLGHIVVVIVMVFVAMYGLLTMRYTLFNLLMIDMKTIVRSGIFYVGFAMVCVVTSQYYFLLKGNENYVFDANEHIKIINVLTDMVIKKSNVENITLDTMTVDNFLLLIIRDVYTKENKNAGVSVEDQGMIVRWAGSMGIAIEKVQNNIEAQAIEDIKSGISEKIGREVRGDELASCVISELISMQLQHLIMSNDFLFDHRAEFFTAIFFLIVLSLATIGKFFAVIFSRFGFMLLREFKFINIVKSQRDAEMIAL